MSIVVVHTAVGLRTMLGWLLALDLLEEDLILSHLVFHLFELMFALFQLALHSMRVAEQRVALVNAFHFYQTVASALFLHDFLLNLLNLWHQLLLSLWWRQITEVVLWAVSGYCVLWRHEIELELFLLTEWVTWRKRRKDQKTFNVNFLSKSLNSL